MRGVIEQERAFAKEGDVRLIGLAKTTGLVTEEGVPVGAVLARVSDASFVCEEVLVPRDARDPAVSLVRLHARSEYVLRCEHWGSMSRGLLGALRQVSADPSFLGYPYPLLLADRLARVSCSECAQLRLHLQALLGSAWTLLAPEEASVDAHSVLDRQ
ncbi:MAG: hypothetical protein HC945_01480, partial [Nitrosarchaeum sp.]|nr:hypothetical protein [Nitrosarchaeum sp.]